MWRFFAKFWPFLEKNGDIFCYFLTYFGRICFNILGLFFTFWRFSTIFGYFTKITSGHSEKKDELRHRLIHLLLSSDLSHSEVLKNISDVDGKTEALVEETLNEIADLVTCKKDTSKKVYQLKKSHQARWAQISGKFQFSES